MDQLSPAEKAEVEGYIHAYPALKQDLYEIEKSLEMVAMGAAIQPSPGLKERILQDIKNNPGGEKPTPGNTGYNTFGSIGGILTTLLFLGLLVMGYFLWQEKSHLTQMEEVLLLQRDSCEQNTQQLNAQLQILQQLTFPDNTIIPFQATPGFASTDLYLHHNTVTKRNFIQVRNLPALADNQSYQLWSLKPDQAPAPLTVFDLPASGLIEVEFEDGTDTYAITIEPKGGRETPTLENLIGTVSVAGM